MGIAESRFMDAEFSTDPPGNASTKMHHKGNILHGGSDRLRNAMRRRLPPGEILSRNLKEAGVTVPEAVRRAVAKGYKISNNTLNYILRNETENPGLFTIEAIAVAIDKAPEQLAAEFFGIRSDDPNFKGSQFAMLHEFYKGLTPLQRQKAEPFIGSLMRELQFIKTQK